jgi:acetyl esterase/lipase
VVLAGTVATTAAVSASCRGGNVGAPGSTTEDGPATGERFRYGEDPSQWADLVRPAGPSLGVVVVIHGGFWKAQYDASLGVPLARDLAERGWTAWNLEYRRVGNGGGRPQTFDDVAAGIDLLAEVDGLDLRTVLTLGHSAGGHLAAWAAARGRYERWPEVVPVTGVVSQAGVLDLSAGAEAGLGAGAVESFVGGPPGPSYDEVDPLRQVPLDVPLRCVHGREDDVVPLTQSTTYVERARAAGADAELLEVPGDHFVLLDTGSQVWDATVDLLAGLAR